MKQELDDLKRQRLEKLNRIKELGISPFAYEYSRSHLVEDVLAQYKENEIDVSLAGRLMSIRRMGKASFAHLMDRTGRIQIYVKKDSVGDKCYDLFKLLDLGDVVGVKGSVFRTRMGEITVQVTELVLLSKTLRPLPIVKEKITDDEKILYDAFADKEMRYRQRYVDLLVNEGVRDVFIKRSQIVSAMRHHLEEKGYLEVEHNSLFLIQLFQF
ncbi:hypothetical protein BVY01_04535 [bacterium I07]|nr:hypothetical protein BVY01_04535 [bacterium I07]